MSDPDTGFDMTEEQIDAFYTRRATRTLIAGLVLVGCGAIALTTRLTVLHLDVLGNIGLGALWVGLLMCVFYWFQRPGRPGSHRRDIDAKASDDKTV